MKSVFVFLGILILCANLHAQARKCVGADGKVAYSDVLCDSRSSSQSEVNTNANTIDHSGLRREAQKLRAEKDGAASSERLDILRQINPLECRFSFMVVGDSKGKKLAANAKEECLRNIEAKRSGQSGSQDAYSLWKDHFAQTSANRQAAAAQANADANAASARANADANATATRNSIDRVGNAVRDKNYTCKPSPLSNALECR